MEIYDQLPYDIKREIIQYFRHPTAQALHDDPWIIREIVWGWPRCPTTKYRIRLAQMICNSRCRKRCGCCYYEQHQVCCDGLEFEDLDTWDPAVRSTPIMQAIQKSNLCHELIKKVNNSPSNPLQQQ